MPPGQTGIYQALMFYQRLCSDRNNGRILTLDGLGLICDAYESDLEAIGKHILETLARIQNGEKGRKCMIINWAETHAIIGVVMRI